MREQSVETVQYQFIYTQGHTECKTHNDLPSTQETNYGGHFRNACEKYHNQQSDNHCMNFSQEKRHLLQVIVELTIPRPLSDLYLFYFLTERNNPAVVSASGISSD